MSYEREILDVNDEPTGEFEHYSPEDWECKDFMKNIAMEFDIEPYKTIDPHELRSYPSHVLGGFNENKIIAGVDVSINIYAVLRSGYYDGACLDWFTEIYLGGNEISSIDEIQGEMAYYIENKGMAAIQGQNAAKWAETALEALTAKVEAVFKKYCEHELVVMATFSNGETIYQKA